MRRELLGLLVAALFGCPGVLAQVRSTGPSALWHIVHDRCVSNDQQHQNPAPCAEVVLDPGYAVLKDIVGNTQFLLIPTARISGIEDPAILAPGAPNYWDAAWRARSFTEQRAGHALPRDVLSLAINSAEARTQDQLHIHIDCVRADVHEALAAYQHDIGTSWTSFPVALAGYRFRAMRVAQPELDGVDPFRLLAASIPADEMRWHTLVVVGASFGSAPGFIILDDRADLAVGNRGWGEVLQDHECALGRLVSIQPVDAARRSAEHRELLLGRRP